MNYFTYIVPETLEKNIQCGQLVSIPFRNSTLLGIVFSLENTSAAPKLKPLHSIPFEEPFISEGFLSFLFYISGIYNISLSALLESSLPELSARTLKQCAIAPLPKRHKQMSLPIYKKYNSTLEHQKIVSESLHGQTLIIVPEKKYIQTIFDFLTKKQQKETAQWQSDLKTTEKRKLWCEIRNNEKKIIVGTRSALFLPFFHLQTLIVDYEHHREHKQTDQAPRFAVKDITPLICSYSGAQEIHMSYAPSVESYYWLHKGGYQNTNAEEILQFKNVSRDNLPLVIDMKAERGAGNMNPLAEKIVERIQATQQDVFLFINRKGMASVLICRDCRYEEKCPTCQLPLVYHEKERILQCHYCKFQKPVPLSCAQCHSTLLKMKGVGTEKIEKYIKEILKGRTDKLILRIEGETSTSSVQEEDPTKLATLEKPKVIIGTERALEFVNWKNTDTIVMVDFDRQVSMPEFRAAEGIWDFIHEIQYSKKPDSRFFIQTWDKKQLLLKSVAEPDRFYRTDLNGRRVVHYPPYGYLVRYYYGHAQPDVSREESTKKATEMSQILTKAGKKCIISGPIEMHPKYSRGKFWYGIIVKILDTDWVSTVKELNTVMTEDWKVDPNPSTLLHI